MKRPRIIVVGGGAAGLMAAGLSATAGIETILLEKMSRPGRKVRITGKGRCNLTNIAEIRDFISQFEPNGKFLRQAFARFFAPDLITFFEGIGVPVATERGGRVFPKSERAEDIVDAMVDWVKQAGVKTSTDEAVTKLIVSNSSVTGVETSNGVHKADAVILTTGGASYPGTGSTGDGYRLAKQIGHTIVPTRPALVPIETGGDIAQRLQGLSLRNVKVSFFVDGKKKADAFGEMLFTHFGLSGPIILTLSRRIVDAVRSGGMVKLSIDLKPALSEEKLDARLVRDLSEFSNRQFNGIVRNLLPGKLVGLCVDHLQIPADKPANQITTTERKQLRRFLKDFQFDVSGYRSINEAIVTAGGVALNEIDPRTMQSRIIKRLYIAGELLDVDGNTGGYNLQAAFSTGHLAGQSAAKELLTNNKLTN